MTTFLSFIRGLSSRSGSGQLDFIASFLAEIVTAGLIIAMLTPTFLAAPELVFDPYTSLTAAGFAVLLAFALLLDTGRYLALLKPRPRIFESQSAYSGADERARARINGPRYFLAARIAAVFAFLLLVWLARPTEWVNVATMSTLAWPEALSLIALALPIAIIIEPMWLLYTAQGIARRRTIRSR